MISVQLSIFFFLINNLLFTKGLALNGKGNVRMYKVSSVFYFELQKFAFLDMRSESDFSLRKTTLELASHTFYSHLVGLYYSLAMLNMTEVYIHFEICQMSSRDEFNLCEMLLSVILYIKFFMPLRVSNLLVKYLMHRTIRNISSETATIESLENLTRLEKLKKLLKHRMFQEFLIDLNTTTVEVGRQNKTVSLISYKRNLFSKPSFLYDLDDCFDYTKCNISKPLALSNGFCSDFIILKFQESLLFAITNQIVEHGGLISIHKILNPQQDEKYEQTEIEQFQFDQFINIYQENMNSFKKAKGKVTDEVFSRHSRNPCSILDINE